MEHNEIVPETPPPHEPESFQAQIKWTIQNFTSKCITKGQASDNHRKLLFSERFSAKGDEEVQWVVCLYPNGASEKCNGWVSISLMLPSSSKTPDNPCSFSLSIGDSTTPGAGFQKMKFKNQIISPGSGFTIGKFVTTRDAVLLGNYLQYGKLTVTCKLEYKKEKEYPDTLSGPFQGYYQPPELLTALSQSSLGRDLTVLFTTMQHSDVSFTVDEKEFRAHKAILSARSPVFAAMFEHPEMKENQLNRVDIEDIKPEVFQILLRFIYTDQVDLKNEETAEELLVVADRYMLKLLKNLCEDFLGGKLSVANCAELLMLADLHNATYLQEMSAGFIRRNSGSVMKTDGWKKMRDWRYQLYCDTVEEILKAVSK